MRYLAELHAQRTWLAPSELLERIVEDRRVLELGASAGRFRDIARRIRFVVDQARSFGQATSGTLREYLAWALRQGAEGARVVETVLPETDDDAVRIMTVHGAKGLEFPIVIASGMTTRAAARRGGVQVLFPNAGGCEIRLASGIQTDQFELHKPVDEEMGFHEKLRLLYVACTRARDHLVVSAHRKARNLGDDQSSWTHAELLWHAADGAVFAGVGRAAAPPARGAGPARRGAARPRDLAGRARAGVRARPRPPLRRGHHAGASGRRTRRGHRSRSGQGTARPRASAVEQGPLRHRDRPRGSRGAADRRPRHRRRASTTPRPRRPRPKACSARKRTIAALAHAAVASTTRADRERARALAGDLRRGSRRGADARGLRRPRLPRRPRARRRRLQDRRHRRRGRARPPARPLPHPGRGLRARGRARPWAIRWPRACSCSSIPTVPARSRSPVTRWPRRSPRSAPWSAPNAPIPSPLAPAVFAEP